MELQIVSSLDKGKQCFEMSNFERKDILTARYHHMLIIDGNEPVERLKIQMPDLKKADK